MFVMAVMGCDGQTYYSIFPPDDYFDPVFAIELQPDVLDYSGEITHPYAGDYSISLSFEMPNPVGDGYDLRALKLDCAFNGGEVTRKLSCGDTLLPYWGEESGISIGIYSIPEAAGKQETVSFRIRFLNPQELGNILGAHGKTSILIRKWSDL